MDKLLNASNSNLNTFKAYDSQLPIDYIEGTRIIKCFYEISPKTGKKVQENAYIRINTKSSYSICEEIIIERFKELAPFVLVYLQSIEDRLVKEAHRNGATNLQTKVIGLDAVINKLEEKELKAKLNKKQIDDWFEAEVSERILDRFLALNSVLTANDLSEDKINRLRIITEAYKLKFMRLASGKVNIKAADCENMLNLLGSFTNEFRAYKIVESKVIFRLNALKCREEKLLDLLI